MYGDCEYTSDHTYQICFMPSAEQLIMLKKSDGDRNHNANARVKSNAPRQLQTKAGFKSKEMNQVERERNGLDDDTYSATKMKYGRRYGC